MFLFDNGIDMGSLDDFIEAGKRMDNPTFLELGTKRWKLDISTKHDAWVPNAGKRIGTDILPGIDVDVVADVHRLSDAFGQESIDIVITCSTFEHFKYPFLAAHEIMKTLKIGGILFIQTHHTFPLHAYPHDYFRFSKEALAALFGSRMGFNVINTEYLFPAEIHSRRDPNASRHPAYLNVHLFGRKIRATPSEYCFELDSP